MPKRILLCDDELHILRALEIKFLRSDYEVFTASDGEEGWEQVQKVQPDLVITDCQMPRLNGLGLAERIHNSPELCHLPVFMLTAKGYELDQAEVSKHYGIKAIVNKPFSPRQVFAMVEQCLNPERGIAPLTFPATESLPF